MAQLTFLGAPFIIGGGVKLVYNTALYLTFRRVEAPEEAELQRAAATGAAPPPP